MKITSFNPTIITKDAEAVVKLFEELGFEKRHAPTGTSALGNEYEAYSMKDANGFHVDIAQTSADREKDMTCIRMNVDNFEEAFKFFTDHGFTSDTGRNTTETGSAMADLLTSPSGFSISLIQHIKHD